jgi:hypothetical protein
MFIREGTMKQDQAYKGYLIRTGLVGDVFVGKGGHWISCHRSVADAKTAIDLVVD